MKRGENLQGALELLILKALEHEANHGFGITTHIAKASSGLLHIEEGSLYPALHRMERQKLITGNWSLTGNGRRARVYRLTEAGKTRLTEVKETWKSVAKGVKKVLKYT